MNNCSECEHYEDDPPWCNYFGEPLEGNDVREVVERK